MEEQVGNLADGILLYAVFGGNYSLGGLFADLFQYFIESLVKKVAGIRALLRVFVPLCNYLVKLSKYVFHLLYLRFYFLKKAGLAAGMAGRAFLYYLYKQRIVVAVALYRDNLLRMTRGFALVPQLLP